MAIHLFIDTNVYLKFYHFSNDDLEELNKLMVLMDNDELELHLPEQIVDEFYRNRDTKLADALKTFNQSKLHTQFPQFCKDHKEYETLKKLIKDYDREKQSLLKNIMHKIETNTLRADKLIEMLFDKAIYVETTKELVDKSRLRYDLGNPPGKNKSYGDAINWECLIENVEDGNDLYFIADDKDYFSELNSSNFNTFLASEWKSKKESQIKFYKTLTDFFKEVFPEIKLATELEKDILIAKLIDSGNFYSSRKTLQKLSKFESFSSEQANQYVSASLNNSQIRWINEYLYEFVIKNEDKIDKELLEDFYKRIPNLKVSAPPASE